MGGKGSGGGTFTLGSARQQREGRSRNWGGNIPFVNWKPIGYDQGKGPIDRSHLYTQGATGERSQDVPRGQSGSGKGFGGLRGFKGREGAAKATGAAAGAALGTFLFGGLGTGAGARLGYRSAQEGYVGDAFNTRRGEGYRDFLEDRGVSRKDVKLAGKHPGTLERAAKSKGYTGDGSGSLMSEGEDYDSITGEIF